MKKYWIMIWEMGKAEFRMRDQGTLLGFLWTLLHPLVYYLVLYGLFSKWMGQRISDFPLYLIIGIVQWNFFASGTSAAITTIMSHGSYIKSINFPKSVLVFSSIVAVLLSHLLELIILIVFWLIVKGHIGIAVVGLIPLLLLNVYLVSAIGFILATVGVYFLDMARIWGIFTSIGLFLTPIFYSLDMLSRDKQLLINMNPMTHIITASRIILIENKMPPLQGLIYVFIVSTVVLAIGYNIFKSKEGNFIEKI